MQRMAENCGILVIVLNNNTKYRIYLAMRDQLEGPIRLHFEGYSKRKEVGLSLNVTVIREKLCHLTFFVARKGCFRGDI